MAHRKRKADDDSTKEAPPSIPPRPARSYEDMADDGDDEHPVDALVDRRLDHAALRRRIRSATDLLMEVLGDEQHLWLRLEELLGEQRLDREAAYFDLGYEHGRAAGRGEALGADGPRTTTAYRALAQGIREAATNAGLPHEHAVAALLEAAWGLVHESTPVAVGTARNLERWPRRGRTRS